MILSTNKTSIIKDLIRIANKLDEERLTAEADILDCIIKQALPSYTFPIGKGEKNKRGLVLAAQKKLLEYGYHMEAGADGDFGRQTEAAVTEFQGQNNFEQTGVITEEQYILLTSGEPKRAAKKRVIVAIGDSITAGGYARELQKKVPDSRTFTFGYGGRQTKFISNKLSLALAKGPDDIIILAGVNDIASNKSVSHIIENLKSMYDRSREAGARIIAVKILPWHARKHSKGKEHITEQVNSQISSYISGLPKEEGHIVVEGNSMYSDDPSKYEMNKEYTNDGIHPNEKGKDMLAQMIADQAFSEKNPEEESLGDSVDWDSEEMSEPEEMSEMEKINEILMPSESN